MLSLAICRRTVIFACLICTIISLVVESNTGDTGRCLPVRYEPEFSCKNETLVVDYSSFGALECGGSYTVSSAQPIPNITLSSAEPDALYTVIFVDTADTFVHPFLHYGAVNVLGADLIAGINVGDIGTDKTFMKYFGPAPPKFMMYVPFLRRNRFLYEWIIAKQSNGKVLKPQVRTSLRMKFREFLRNTEVVASTHLNSGFCVR